MDLRFLLPHQQTRYGPLLTGAGVSHAVIALLLLLLAWVRPAPVDRLVPIEAPSAELIWTALTLGGGGGGGERSPEPPPVARETAVRPPAPPPTPVSEPEIRDIPVEPLVGAQLNAVPLDAPPALVGLSEVAGASRGPGSGTGVGGLRGSGSGPDAGPGLGPGSLPGAGPGNVPGGGRLAPPTIAFSPKPRYTADAMRARIEGEVHVQCLALPTGVVEQCRVVRSLEGNAYGLDEEALRTAAQFRFNPATRGGAPVSSPVLIILEFNMR